MIATKQDPVERYLKRLDAELRDLPRARRREIVDEIQEHIVEAGAESEAELLTLLDRLGDPADIAAEARERFVVEERGDGGVMEVAALILLLIGGVVIPFLGWLVGVVLLWSSKVWSTRDKLLGTLIVPGGLATAGFFLLTAGLSTQICHGEGDLATGVSHEVCTGGPSTVEQILQIALLAFLVLGPIATAIYLGRRLSAARG